MAETIRATIGDQKKGKLIMIDGDPCKISNITYSKPGKHGPMKARVEAVSMISGNRKNLLGGSDMEIEVPILTKRDAQVVALIGEDKVQLMDLETFDNYELEIPEDLRGQITQGATVEIEEAPNFKIISRVRK